jgi:hypothetical protein
LAAYGHKLGAFSLATTAHNADADSPTSLVIAVVAPS